MPTPTETIHKADKAIDTAKDLVQLADTLHDTLYTIKEALVETEAQRVDTTKLPPLDPLREVVRGWLRAEEDRLHPDVGEVSDLRLLEAVLTYLIALEA
jgi:hypothetical protein